MDKSNIRAKKIAAPRRTHNKSRKGCHQCKDRHVKCDEKRPACSLCIKRELSCANSLPQAPSSRESPSTLRSSENEGDNPTVCESPHRARLYEMRLFHHFIVHTSHTLTSCARDKYLWQTVVPHLATSHNYVMDSVLAIAALHIASTNPTDSQGYIHSALDYHTRALTGSRMPLALGNTQDGDACAVCSICILIATSAYSNISHEKNQKDPLDYMLEKRMILKGTRFLVRGLDRASMHPLLEEWQYGDVGNDDHMELAEEANSKLKSLHGEVLEKLREVGCELEHAHPSHKELLRSTHELLVQAISFWPVHSGVMQWSLEISDEYVDLLKQGNWLARVLLMFYGLGLHLSSKRWVIQDSGRRLVLSILPRKSEIPSYWVDLVTWIAQALDR